MAPNPEDEPEQGESTPETGVDPTSGHDDGMVGAGQAFFTMFLAFVFTFGGIALALGPKFSWKIEQVSRGFSYLGVHGGTLLVGGVLLAGISLVLRAQSIAAETANHGDEDVMLERVAGDVHQMHNSIDHLSRCVATFEKKIEQVTKEVRDIEIKMPDPAPAPAAPELSIDPGQKDAIFRLAASVDHVGARIDHRLKAQYKELFDRLEEITSVVTSMTAEEATRGELGATEAALPQTDDETNLEPLLADERLGAAIEDLRKTESTKKRKR